MKESWFAKSIAVNVRPARGSLWVASVEIIDKYVKAARVKLKMAFRWSIRGQV
jgi:hypothetical protein